MIPSAKKGPFEFSNYQLPNLLIQYSQKANYRVIKLEETLQNGRGELT